MKLRSTLITGLAHAVALILLALAALLLATDWPVHPALTGVRRAAFGLYLAVNTTVLELYMIGRSWLPRAPLHFTAIHAGLSLNEILLRSLALVNIGLAAAALVIAEQDRWWLVALAALGLFAFRLSIDFPDRGSRDWTIGDVIRHYAQPSKHYARWLGFRQLIYGTAAVLIWLASIALLVLLIGVGANFVYDAFLADADPTWPQLRTTMLSALKNAGAWLARALPIMGAIVLVAAVFQAVVQWWMRPSHTQDPLSEVFRRGP